TIPVQGPHPRVNPATLLLWRDSNAANLGRDAVDQNRVYTLSSNVVYAVDKSTGAPLWSTAFTYPPEVNATLLGGIWVGLAGGLVIVGDVDLFGLDPATGAIVWRFAPRTTLAGERTFQLLVT